MRRKRRAETPDRILPAVVSFPFDVLTAGIGVSFPEGGVADRNAVRRLQIQEHLDSEFPGTISCRSSSAT